MQSQENTCRSSEFWGICCEGGKKYSQVVRQKFHITMAALDPTVVPTSPIVSLMVDRGGCEYLLCSLKPSSLLQVNLDLYFDKGEKVTFSLRGLGKIHLSGYHIYGKNEPAKSEDTKSNKFASPQKKVAVTSPKKDNKSKVIKQDSDDSSEEEEVKDTKKASPKKDVLKSMKVSNNTDEESDDEDSFDELDDSLEDDESEEEDERKKDSKNDAKKLQSYKRLWSSLRQSDEEEEKETDSSESDEQEKESPKKVDKDFQNRKRLKNSTSTPVPNKKTKNTMEKTEVIDIGDDEPTSVKKTPKPTNEPISGKKTPKQNNEPMSVKKTPKQNDALMNSSLGRTPMPQRKTPKTNQGNVLTEKAVKKVTFTESEEDSSDMEEDTKSTSLQATPSKNLQMNESSSLSPTKKKKKKKKKSLDTLNVSTTSDSANNKGGKTSLSSASFSNKLPGGLEFEDIRSGNGPIAKKGKLVHVYYTGMLENNKVFDRTEPGKKPFSFKLGSEQVIKGWDLGIEGMKVGGKRRLKIPAHLGYKNKKIGPIPPNSTLYFSVELKAVS